MRIQTPIVDTRYLESKMANVVTIESVSAQFRDVLAKTVSKNPTNIPREVVSALLHVAPSAFLIKKGDAYVGALMITWTQIQPTKRIANLHFALNFELSGDKNLITSVANLLDRFIREHHIDEVQTNILRENKPHISFALGVGFDIIGITCSPVLGNFILLSKRS